MSPALLARTCGVLGGLAWVARWWLDRGGPSSAAGAAAYWAGLGLLVIACTVSGAGLVSRQAAGWLRMLAGIAPTVLAVSVLLVVHDSIVGPGLDPDARTRAVDAGAGVAAVLVWGGALLLRRPRPVQQVLVPRPRAGEHAGAPRRTRAGTHAR